MDQAQTEPLSDSTWHLNSRAILTITNEAVSVPKTTEPATKGLRRHRVTRSCHPELQAPQTLVQAEEGMQNLKAVRLGHRPIQRVVQVLQTVGRVKARGRGSRN